MLSIMKLVGIHVNKLLVSSLICIILLLTSLLLFTKAAGPPPDDPDHGEVRLSAADNGHQIELKEGQVLVISLEGNPSTGYAWEIDETNETILRQTGEVEFEPEVYPLGDPVLLGAPAQQIMRFEAMAAGQTDLRLVYRRPWEKDVKPARTFSVQVQGVGPFTHVKSPTPAPPAEPSNLQLPTSNFQTSLGLPSAYNWCNLGKCTPVKDQGNCGSCWTFGTVGPLESNIKIKDGLEKDLAEQYLLSCNTDGWSCNGGWWAHDYHWNKMPSGEPDAGAVYEADFPYTARDDPCNPPHTHHKKIVSWAFVGSEYGVPSVASIKQAIYDHGPVSVAVCAGSAFQNYSGGVFQTNEYCPGYVNHAVVLVGWDDSQGSNGIWYLKNSWGESWGEEGDLLRPGEKGYMRIGYGISNVGYSANYIVYSGGSCQDAYESDDTYTSAKTITVNGAAQHRTFDTSSDEDWGQFTVTAGEAYTITTSNLLTGNDTILELYNTDGTTKLRDDECMGQTSCINNWTAPSTGTYFIRVRHNLNGAGGGVKIYLPLITKSGGIANCIGYEYDLAIVDSNPCRDTQVVQNGGFESGNTIWVQQQSGSSDPIIGQYYPHSGSWSAWFGGYNNADDRLYQTINIPVGISSARLVFYLYIGTFDSPYIAHDYFHVELQEADGTFLDDFLWANNTMSSSYWWKGTMEWSDFSSHASQARRLFFQGETDEDLVTNFFVDDVTLWTYCGGLPAGDSQATSTGRWTWEKVETPPGYVPVPYNEQVRGKHKNE